MLDVDTEVRERIAELTARLSSHERHCEERNANLRAFMDQIERQRLASIWRWIVSVLGLLIVSMLGLMTSLLSRSFFT